MRRATSAAAAALAFGLLGAAPAPGQTEGPALATASAPTAAPSGDARVVRADPEAFGWGKVTTLDPRPSRPAAPAAGPRRDVQTAPAAPRLPL